MKKIALLILININVSAQNQNSVWIFGDSAGINFNGGAMPIASAMDARGSSVSICDNNGNLILYAFTLNSSGAWSTHIYNSTNSSIIGADSITGSGWYNELGLFPKPGSSNMFYVFSNSVGVAPNPGMYYTLVDMNLNGGLGAVVQENIQLDSSYYGDCLTTVKHGNGRDWWVISKINNFPFTFHNRFYAYLVTNDSIYAPIIQDFNDAVDGSAQKICWHPSFNKFMLINTRGYMSEFNFNRCSGTITLGQNIFPEQQNNFTRPFWEGAYSPNGNLFYVSRTSYGGNYGNKNYLLQYDLTAANIPASCDTLDSTTYPPADCGAVRLAPDGKIYYTQAYPYGIHYADTMRNTINQNLGVINNPDVAGSGCNFAPFSFYLGGKRTYYGLPNNPNYSLAKLVGSPCDTITGLPGHLTPEGETPALQTTYISAWQKLFVNAQHLKGKNGVLTIYDLNGRNVFSSSTKTQPPYFTLDIDCSSFSNGLYLINLTTEKEKLSCKFVKN